MIKTLALNGKALLTNNKELGWEFPPTNKLYYENLSEFVGPSSANLNINVAEFPYFVLMFDFKVGPDGRGAGGTHFIFNNDTIYRQLRTRDHTVYNGSSTSILETGVAGTIVNDACSRINNLDGYYNYFVNYVSPRTYHTHAYLMNIESKFLKIYFDKIYMLNTTCHEKFTTLTKWETTQESNQVPYIKNIYVYGFATEEEAIDFIVNGTLNK